MVGIPRFVEWRGSVCRRHKMPKGLLRKINESLWILYGRALFALEDRRRRNIVLLAPIGALMLIALAVVGLLILVSKDTNKSLP